MAFASVTLANFGTPASLRIASRHVTSLAWCHACFPPTEYRIECFLKASGSPASVSHCGHVSPLPSCYAPNTGAPASRLIIAILAISGNFVWAWGVSDARKDKMPCPLCVKSFARELSGDDARVSRKLFTPRAGAVQRPHREFLLG